jgi:hypothetical protein
MDLSSPVTSLVLFWTITRAAALAVLATEAVFLLRRARSAHPEGTGTSRFVWSATPALMLAGLSLWCLVALPAPRSSSAPVAFASSSPPHR